jgi:hypothetical protein
MTLRLAAVREIPLPSINHPLSKSVSLPFAERHPLRRSHRSRAVHFPHLGLLQCRGSRLFSMPPIPLETRRGSNAVAVRFRCGTGAVAGRFRGGPPPG